MKVSQLKDLLADRPDDEELFIVIWELSDAENIIDYDDEDAPSVTPEQWSRIVRQMDTDESIHQQVSESFSYYVEERNSN